MKNSLICILSFFLIVLISACSKSGIVIDGVVRDGLSGIPVEEAKVSFKNTGISSTTDEKGYFSLTIPLTELEGIDVKVIDSIQYFIPDFDEPAPFLVAQKTGFQDLKYPLNLRTNGLALNILPEPIEYNAEDYTGENISFTEKLDKEVQWEDIIDGVRTFYENRIPEIKNRRKLYWDRDTSSAEAYNSSVAPNRERFRTILGAIDEREHVSMEKLNKVAETESYTIYEVQWPVLKEIIPGPPLQDWPEIDVPRKIFGEGLYLEVKGNPKGYTIAVPDADQHPEELAGLLKDKVKGSQYALHLAENGFNVVIPVIVDRTNRWSRGTDRSSRSWIYSQSHEMGRTVTGYEIQKLQALVDWFTSQGGEETNIGIAGYGEGGLLALYTAALDTRIDAALVSGYFAPRERIWEEPIYRNVWSLLTEFGDAELASLIAPRSLVVEYSNVPAFDSEQNAGKKIEAPGKLWTHAFNEVEEEFNRIDLLTGENIGNRTLINNANQNEIPFCAENSINQFMQLLGHSKPAGLTTELPVDIRQDFDP
ncbi:MAG TPA: dienelactone hydrolase family protein, partial [Mariniphaga sp.]|nr:dienelactone hydrolase family protein [Mariniphaga sp.]